MSEERLEDFRYRMLIRGYMNKKEFQRFMDCGYKTATKLWNRFLSDIGCLGLSEKKIIEAHERA